MESLPLPLFIRVKRSLSAMDPVDAEVAMTGEWKRLGLADAVSGKRIAIGVGSRGISDLPKMVKRLVDLVRGAGGTPFIVPAMGSHGGATAEGQTEVLASLGITEAAMGCGIEATMDTVILGTSPSGLPAHFDARAAAADGVMLVNRVKMHTSFHGELESGIHKMLAIGMGKERAASLLHSKGPDGLRDLMPEVARVLLSRTKFLAGFGVVEDGYHRPVMLRGLSAAEAGEGEKEMLRLARSLAPGLPLREADVLVVDEIGKDVSGTGMDTNVVGRLRIAGQPEPKTPKVKAIVVLGLTEATHGNALGIGLADFTTRRAAQAVDWRLTAKNVLTSGFLERGRVPLALADEAEALDAALGHVFRDDPAGRAGARVLRIRNTLQLEDFWVSENLRAEIEGIPGFLSASAPQAFAARPW